MRAVILAGCLVAAVPVLGQTPSGGAVAQSTFGADRFAAGSSVEVSEPVAGDAFLTGGEVTVGAPVGGGAFAAGGHVDIQAPVAKNLYAAGGSVTVSNAVQRSAWLLGDTVAITPAATIGGSLSLAGRSVTLAGAVHGPVRIAARDLVISGRIDGNAEVSAERIEIGPEARIGGRLRYRAGELLQVADGAQIAGGLEQQPGRETGFGWHERARRATEHGVRRDVWFGTSFVIGALMLLIGPAFMSETSGIARRAWAQSLGIGLAVLVAVPLAVLLLFITLIGIPLGLVAVALYAAVLLLGYVCGATAVGDLALERLAPARAARVGWRILALLGALIVLAIVRHVPLLGGLAVFAVLLGGVGALVQRTFRRARPASAA